jgi:uncharacterized membrane protein
MAVMYGPIQMFVIGFPGNKFSGEILPALDDAKKKGLIRLIDYLFITKDAKGNITSIEGTDLGKDEVIKLGAGIGALLGLGAGGMEGAKVGAKAGAEFAAEGGFGYSIDDIMNLGADEIPNNSSALIMLVEHLWAKSIKDALRNSGAVMISQGMLQPEAIVLMGAALAEAEKKK